MPQVVNPTYALGDPQIDGRMWVTETRPVDDGSGPIVSQYLADPGADYQAHLDAMAAADNAALNPPAADT